MKNESEISDISVVLAVFVIPTLMLLGGYVLVPYPPSDFVKQLSFIPLFLGLILLGVGMIWRNKKVASMIKIAGWGVFASFWATMPSFLYLSEGGDIFNAAVCIIGVYVLIYVTYHEWLSIKKNEYPVSLQWIAGGTFLAGIIYFTVDAGVFPWLKNWLIETVATQSKWLLDLFGLHATQNGPVILFQGSAVTIIFACTAIQSMVLFVGMIGALPCVRLKRKVIGISVTVIPIYLLNLIRNAGVVYMVGTNLTTFDMAHNVIGKIGSLIALIVLLFLIFKLLPELYDMIIGFIDLPKRNGPVENMIHQLLGKKEHASR